MQLGNKHLTLEENCVAGRVEWFIFISLLFFKILVFMLEKNDPSQSNFKDIYVKERMDLKD